MSDKTVKELAYNPEPKPEDTKEQWKVFNKMWVEQVKGKGLKLYKEWAGAPAKAIFVGDPFADYMPNGEDEEIQTLIKDNASQEVKDLWIGRSGQRVRDFNPELFEKFVAGIDARDKAYEKEGITVIRNKLGWYPDSIVNWNDSWAGSKFLSIYAGGAGYPLRNFFMNFPDAASVNPYYLAIRALVIELMRWDEDATPLVWFEKEPDPGHPGPGEAALDGADMRLFPNKQLTFIYSCADKSHISDDWDMDTRLTPSGTPRGSILLKRMLKDRGFTYDTVWYDSRLTYHHDCFMLNIKEGICGLPDAPNYGYWTDPPKAIKDWEIIPIPLDEQKMGVCNSVTTGTGKVFMDDRCVKTMELLDKHGIEPIPIPYGAIWDTFNSGLDCSDMTIWREDD